MCAQQKLAAHNRSASAGRALTATIDSVAFSTSSWNDDGLYVCRPAVLAFSRGSRGTGGALTLLLGSMLAAECRTTRLPLLRGVAAGCSGQVDVQAGARGALDEGAHSGR